ncbi:MAG: BT4734/BF3469 family protein, partial [Saprospiraceae bacterium]|nr:BT4734/BF3469 family protein [Saprospiraceae bacterium]
MMKQITIFRHFTQVIGSRTLPEIVGAIQQGVYLEEVLAVRRAVQRGDRKVADETKKSLHAFTVSGQFEGGRTMERLKAYHPLVILDIDKLKEEELNRVNQVVRELPYTQVCFLSPSGNGCKIIVKVNSTQSQHLSAYIQVSEFYERKLNIKIDQSGKDITRLCFFSFDKDIFYNENSKVFTVKETLVKPLPFHTVNKLEQPQKTIPLKQNFKTKNGMEKCLAFTQQKMQYVEGNRNNFIYLFASNCNREGISESEVLSFALSEFDLDNKEIRKSVASSYQHHISEFGSKTLTIKKSKEENKIHFWESLKQTPLIPEKVFRLLPSLLDRGCEVFDEPRERDV